MHPLSPLRDVLHVQDKIIAIDDEDVQELSANDVGKLLLGSSGSSKNKRRKRMMTVIREQRDDDILVVGTSDDASSGYDDNDMTDNNVKHSHQPGTFISQQKIQAISNEEEHEVLANNGTSNNNARIDNDIATLENVASRISNANDREHDPEDGATHVNDTIINPPPPQPPPPLHPPKRSSISSLTPIIETDYENSSSSLQMLEKKKKKMKKSSSDRGRNNDYNANKIIKKKSSDEVSGGTNDSGDSELRRIFGDESGVDKNKIAEEMPVSEFRRMFGDKQIQQIGVALASSKSNDGDLDVSSVASSSGWSSNSDSSCSSE